MTQYAVLHHGAVSDGARKLAAAGNRRVDARDLDDFTVKVDDTVSTEDLEQARKLAWALGALSATYEGITHDREIPVGVQRMIRNPGTRNDKQLARAHTRMTQMRADRKRRGEVSDLRQAIVREAKKAAANYRANPTAYHYKAQNAIANTIYLKPSPLNYRSDCSQFVGAVYKGAGAPSPAAPLDYLWVATSTIVKSPHARITTSPKPADLGMYGDGTGPLANRGTHHVELFIDEPGCRFIGHGSPPIDSITPGEPDFYVTFDFLD